MEPIILTIFLAIIAIIAILRIMPQIFFNKCIRINWSFISFSKTFTPKSLLIDPSSIEFNITSKDLQSEWVKTITITNIWKEKKDIQIQIGGFQDMHVIIKDFTGYIENQVAAINIKNLNDRRKVNKHLKEMSPSSSIVDLNMKIAAINENIINYNSNINLIYYDLKTSKVQKIIPRKIDIYINKLNNKINIINEMPESSFYINAHVDSDIIENIKFCIDNLRKEIKDLESLPDANTPISIYSRNIIKLSLKDKAFSLDKDDTKFIILKIIIPYGLQKGEYRGEISINNKINDKKTKKLGVIPISINSTNTESKKSIQTENKSANSTNDSKSDSTTEKETKSTNSQS